MSLDAKNLLQAIEEAKSKSQERKFVQSIELIINLKEIDPKSPESRIQQIIELPHSPGKENKICVIASGETALKARKAGANLVIERGELEALADDKKRRKELARTYDFFIAEAPLMPLVGRVLGATLGPRGKMPAPLPPAADMKKQIAKYRKTVLVRMRGQPVIQCRVGGEKMSNEEIAENVQATMKWITGKLKRGVQNVRSVYLKLAMGPPVKVKM